MNYIIEKLKALTDEELLAMGEEKLEELQDDCSNLLSEYMGLEFYYAPDPIPEEAQQSEKQVREQYYRIDNLLGQIQ